MTSYVLLIPVEQSLPNCPLAPHINIFLFIPGISFIYQQGGNDIDREDLSIFPCKWTIERPVRKHLKHAKNKY
jgi:hypothetical protein